MDIDGWLASRGFINDEQLSMSPTQGLQFLNYIGVTPFLLAEQCSKQDSRDDAGATSLNAGMVQDSQNCSIFNNCCFGIDFQSTFFTK